MRKKQIDAACEKGVYGFKIICDDYCVGEKKSMKTIEYIAKNKKPILFHSGILWDGENSSQYNRPALWECLLDIKGIKFSLAHAAWPWYDECLAIYGKFLNAYNGVSSPEMFIDITPGTPKIYRKDLLDKILTIGYDIEDNIVFGSDCNANDYNVGWTDDWIKTDNKIYKDMDAGKNIMNKIYKDNLKRFLGVSKSKALYKKLVPRTGISLSKNEQYNISIIFNVIVRPERLFVKKGNRQKEAAVYEYFLFVSNRVDFRFIALLPILGIVEINFNVGNILFGAILGIIAYFVYILLLQCMSLGALSIVSTIFRLNFIVSSILCKCLFGRIAYIP